MLWLSRDRAGSPLSGVCVAGLVTNQHGVRLISMMARHGGFKCWLSNRKVAVSRKLSLLSLNPADANDAAASSSQ